MSGKVITNILKEHIGAILRWVVVAALAGVIGYGDGRWAKTAEVSAHIETEAKAMQTLSATLATLPPRIDVLEKESIRLHTRWMEVEQWRRNKDEIDTRLTIILENQQKQMDRQQQLIDEIMRRAK